MFLNPNNWAAISMSNFSTSFKLSPHSQTRPKFPSIFSPVKSTKGKQQHKSHWFIPFTKASHSYIRKTSPLLDTKFVLRFIPTLFRSFFDVHKKWRGENKLENKSRFYFISIYGRDLFWNLSANRIWWDFVLQNRTDLMRFLALLALFYASGDSSQIFEWFLLSQKQTSSEIGWKSHSVLIRYTHFHLQTRKNVISFYAKPRTSEKIPWESQSK